ncbi:MAG: peptide chain release factor N(5)-glutamine methyltransferase [Caulobacteraceae bacterium]|nr:peptide chain release factor N(5)-glutamine methyltransferase [Caulobacteraceae bacterium]MBK8542241.1 peptide chain release factor N(5)-glutamine methyltransferase [Caulobacteraceae bacterium]
MSKTLVSVWTDVRKRLEAAGVDSPVLDARLLLEAGAGVSRLDIVTDPRRAISDEQVHAVDVLTKRREAREPVSHILGRKHFWTLDLAVSANVLTPRPETEFVVEAGLQETLPADAPHRILDLGTGSGAIMLALLKERPNATGVAIDISEEALAVVRANAEQLGVAERLQAGQGNWAEHIDERFDLVVSNPPYIRTSDIDGLEPEVSRFEPRVALDGGADGLAAYRIIAAALPSLLKPGGAFALEVGAGQAESVKALAEEAGLATGEPRRDLSGIPRVVVGRAV